VTETPLTPAVNLSNRLECNVLLKREDLQPVFSFKLRGAYNKMAHLPPKDRWRGVVACSAGMTASPWTTPRARLTRVQETTPRASPTLPAA
jgi:threonine dehydratase